VLAGCKHDKLKIDVSHIEISFNTYHFEKIFFDNETKNVIDTLLHIYVEHTEFIDIYTENVIQIGNIHHQEFPEYLHSFVSDTVIRQTADSVLTVFNNFSEISAEIEHGFKHYRHYFPDKPIPSVYTYISGFNESLVIAENFIGISLDKYLGINCGFYPLLGVPTYKTLNMHPGKIISDLFYAWGLTEFPNPDYNQTLLNQIIYHGKLMYFTNSMLPQVHDSLLIGYTNDQLEWCKNNEGNMWSYLIEKGELYSNERLSIQRYINDAPFTNTFSSDSPGRTGVWLGWQIVRSFMNNNKDITLKQLMEIDNAQDILNRSGYHP
jgi:hypothetical protein